MHNYREGCQWREQQNAVEQLDDAQQEAYIDEDREIVRETHEKEEVCSDSVSYIL